MNKHVAQGRRRKEIIEERSTCRKVAKGFGYVLLSSLSLLIILNSNHSFAQTNTDNNYYYENAEDGFRVKIPDGWVIEDIDNTDLLIINEETSTGIITLAVLCKAEDSLPGIGETYSCTQNAAPRKVFIYRLGNLHSRPELKVLEQQNKSITPLDLVALQIKAQSEFFQSMGMQRLRINSTNDTIVNLINPETNQTTAAIPAKFVAFTYEIISPNSGGGISKSNGKMFDLFVLSNNTNTGYSVNSAGWFVPSLAPSSDVKQIMDSFELIE